MPVGRCTEVIELPHTAIHLVSMAAEYLQLIEESSLTFLLPDSTSVVRERPAQFRDGTMLDAGTSVPVL